MIVVDPGWVWKPGSIPKVDGFTIDPFVFNGLGADASGKEPSKSSTGLIVGGVALAIAAVFVWRRR